MRAIHIVLMVALRLHECMVNEQEAINVLTLTEHKRLPKFCDGRSHSSLTGAVQMHKGADRVQWQKQTMHGDSHRLPGKALH